MTPRTPYLDKLKPLVTVLARYGADSITLVGGAIRDAFFMDIEPSDLDVEVFGLPPESVMTALSTIGDVKEVGKSFGIFKLKLEGGLEVDVSLPRKDSKTGPRHQDVQCTFDEDMNHKEAAARRDFTINAMALELHPDHEGDFHDPFNGQHAILASTLKHTDVKHFMEDPLRVLRGMQFAARYGLHATVELVQLCRRMKDEIRYLPKERIWGEWQKLIFQGRWPSHALEFLYATDWCPAELGALQQVAQQQKHHPEGNAWAHTLHVADAAFASTWDPVVRMASLCHDMGKALTLKSNLSTPGHAEAGEAPTRAFLDRIGAPASLVEPVVKLVKDHLFHLAVNEVSPRGVRRLARRLAPASIEQLVLLIKADHAGRPPLDPECPLADKLLALAKQHCVDKKSEEKIIGGRDLIKANIIEPGPAMGVLLNKLFELQLDGKFASREGGIYLAREIVKTET